MNVPRSLQLSIGVFATTWLAGCASIMSGRHADVAIDSYPSNAQVEVYDKRGQRVASAQTPAVVALKRGDGYFKPARYKATIHKPGYQPTEVPIKAGLNPWVLGNVVFGGIAGLVVDPFTGAAWRLTPSDIRPDLVPLGGPALAESEAPTAAQAAAPQAMHAEVAQAGHVGTLPATTAGAAQYLSMPQVQSTAYPSTPLSNESTSRF